MQRVGPDYPRDMGLELDGKLVALIIAVLTVSVILIGLIVQTT